jgi:hypothetical protein
VTRLVDPQVKLAVQKIARDVALLMNPRHMCGSCWYVHVLVFGSCLVLM